MIELDPEHARLYYPLRGQTKSRLGDYQGTIEDYTKAIKLLPKYGLLYYYRGVVKSKLGDQSGSESDLNRAKELGYNPLPITTRRIFKEHQMVNNVAF